MIRKMPVLAKAGMGTGFAAKIMLKQKKTGPGKGG